MGLFFTSIQNCRKVDLFLNGEKFMVWKQQRTKVDTTELKISWKSISPYLQIEIYESIFTPHLQLLSSASSLLCYWVRHLITKPSSICYKALLSAPSFPTISVCPRKKTKKKKRNKYTLLLLGKTFMGPQWNRSHFGISIIGGLSSSRYIKK